MDAQNTKPSLISVGDLFSQAWSIYTKRFWTLNGIMLVPALAAMSIAFVPILGVFLPAEIRAGVIAFLSISIILLILIISPCANIAVFVAINGAQEKIGMKEAYRLSWSKYWSFCWVCFLFILLSAIASLFFVVPGIICWIWFSFAVFVCVFEESRGMDALKKSKEYVRGYWWGVFGRILLLLVLSYLTGLIGIFLSFSGIGYGKEIAGIINILVSFLIVPFSVTYYFLIYADLRRIKEQSVNPL